MMSSNNNCFEYLEFCDSCVTVNPNDAKSIKSKIVFSTGCKSARCVADLNVHGSLENVPRLIIHNYHCFFSFKYLLLSIPCFSFPYILGSSSSITINYNILNNGETAYLAQIKITLPDSVTVFTKIPSNCKLDELAVHSNVMQCDLNSGRPMFKGDKTSLKMSIDTTKLEGKNLVVKAYVYSTGDEFNESDNRVENTIPLGEFSEIEIFGYVVLKLVFGEKNLENHSIFI